MAVAGAILAVVWIRAPRYRLPCGVLLVLVGVAIIMTNGHWLSDENAGAFLGAFTGWLTVRRSPA